VSGVRRYQLLRPRRPGALGGPEFRGGHGQSHQALTGLTGQGPFSAEIEANPELATVLSSFDQIDYLYRFLIVAVYGTVIVLSVVFQGLNALYYFTRGKHIEAYVRETPGWVLDLQRMTTPS